MSTENKEPLCTATLEDDGRYLRIEADFMWEDVMLDFREALALRAAIDSKLAQMVQGKIP